MNMAPSSRRLARFILSAGLALAAVYLFLRVGGYVLPVILGVALALMLEPMVRYAQRRLNMNRKYSAPIILVLFYLVLLTLVGLLAWRVCAELLTLARNSPQYAQSVSQWLNTAGQWLQTRLERMPQGVPGAVNGLINGVVDAALSEVQNLVLAVMEAALALPEVLLFAFVMVISTALTLNGRDKAVAFAKTHLPKNCICGIIRFKARLSRALCGYAKAQAKLMCVMFGVLLAGFLIMGLEYGVLLALGVAVVDALPVFGAGIFLVPASIYGFLAGDLTWGIGFAVIFIVSSALRQILEPRMVGKEMGLHPIITLTAVYAGLRIGGILGMIIGPIVAIVVKTVFVMLLNGRTLAQYIDGAQPDKGKPPS